ncbi:MAG TPA: hypothetical protein VG755_12540 [Nannocystaceae bacterium]|nr:hypothetical protein [Nannocystaceae bacterium]
MSLASRIALALASCAAGCLVDNPAWDGRADGSGSASGSTGDTGDEPRDCMPLPAADGEIVMLDPSQAAQLDELIATAASGTTFVLADGSYDRSGEPAITIAAPGVTLRSETGDRDAVVLDGGGTTTLLVAIAADDVTLAELTLRGSADRLVAIAPTGGVAPQRPRIHRVHFADAHGFQLALEADFAANAFVDDGEVACSTFETSAAFRELQSDCNGMSAIKSFGSAGWRVRDNVFEGFWCPSSAAFVTVHFGYGARDTIIERNAFRDNNRGPMLGWEADTMGTRAPPDGATCPNAQHFDGTMRNNMVWVGGAALAASPVQPDTMMSAWSACDVVVQYNTLVNLFVVGYALDPRFSDTTGSVVDNLMTDHVEVREGATIIDSGNVVDVGFGLFVDASAGDLHLVAGATQAIDAGVSVAATPPSDDFDGEPRDDAPDVGADEYVP